MPVDPFPVVPVFVDPVFVDPVFVDPVPAPPEAVPVGLVLVPSPGPGELDVGEAGVEELLPGADEDPVGLGLAALDAGAVPVGQGVRVGLAGFLPPVALALAFAEAVEMDVLMAVALVVSVAGAVAVSPGLVLPSGPPLVPPSVALSDGLLTELAGVSLGVADVVGLAAFVGLAGADDAEPDAHAIARALPWAPEVPCPAPPAAEPTGVPSPFVL